MNRTLATTAASALLAIGLLAAGAPRLKAQTTLGSRVAAAPEGRVQFNFPARAGVCGDGRNFVSIDGNMHIGTFTSMESNRANCTPGPIRVVIERAGRSVIAIHTFAGPVGAGDEAGAVTDLGAVPAADAASYLLDLAATLDGRPGRDAIMPASLADGVDASPKLLQVARDASRPVDTRRSAMSWLVREAESPAAASRAGEALVQMARDDAQPRAVRQQALSVLARLENGAGIPQVIALTRVSDDAWLTREAVSVLARSGDPRARAGLRDIVQRAALPDDAMAAAARGLGGQYATAEDAALLRTTYSRLPGERSRAAAISAVAELGGAENVRWLLGIARNDRERESHRRAAMSGARRAGAGASEIAGIYDGGDNVLRGLAVSALAESSEPAAVEKLLAIARSGDDRAIRRRAVAALAKIDDPKVKAALADIVER